MSLTWTAPAALWLLLVVPLIWVARRWGRTNFNARQQMLQAGVRSLLLAALALALARPVISMGSSRLSVVYLVDLSHSISSRSCRTTSGSYRSSRAVPRRPGSFPPRSSWRS